LLPLWCYLIIHITALRILIYFLHNLAYKIDSYCMHLNPVSLNQTFRRVLSCCMSKKSWPILYSNLSYKIGQDFLHICHSSNVIGFHFFIAENKEKDDTKKKLRLFMISEPFTNCILCVQRNVSNIRSGIDETSWTHSIKPVLTDENQAFKPIFKCN